MTASHLNRGEIRDRQARQLRRLLGQLIPGNRFYAPRLEAAGCTPETVDLEGCSRLVPFTTKVELVEDQAAHPPYGTNLTWPIERYTRFHQTSGTTGRPLRWLDTPESWAGLIESWIEVFRAAEVHRGDRVLFPFTFGPFIGFWMAFEAAEKLGCLCLPAGGLSSTARLRMILDNEVTVLCCTPTYAARLAEVASAENIDLARAPVRTLIVAGEPGGSIPPIRARLEQFWNGARVYDHHGMTEVGPVTYECPRTPGCLHVIESAYWAEVIDPASARPVDSGQTGELVFTTLGRAGSPLLRYRTGDLVRPRHHPADLEAAPCACGRHELALEGGILGRIDDMIIVRGVNLYPSAIEAEVRRFNEIAEFQVEIGQVHELTELKLTIEPAADCANPATLIKRLQKILKDAFALRVPIEQVSPGSLPRFEMKARRWIRKSSIGQGS